MHKLVICGLIACVGAEAARALDTQICDAQTFCPSYTACVNGQPIFPSDLHGSMAEEIGWRSQVFRFEKKPTAWTYCYFRAIGVSRPGNHRPIRWRPGGITFFGATGDENRCAAVCELGDKVHKPAKDSISGTIQAGVRLHIEADAPSWALESGSDETHHKPAPGMPVISRPHLIVSNAVVADTPAAANLRIEMVSKLFADGKIGYLISNLSRFNVRVAWNIPINRSLKVAELALMGRGILLAPGASYLKIVDPASQPGDKDVASIERPSQVLVDVAGRPIIIVNLTDIAPRNGEYETPFEEFIERGTFLTDDR